MRPGIAVAVVALGLFGVMSLVDSAGRAETLPCGSGTLEPAAAVVNTFESVVTFDGVANAAGDAHNVRFCGQDTMYMQVVVTWKGTKDLRLTLVAPDGSTYVGDNHSGTSYEWYIVEAPLSHGDWSVTVNNNSRGNVGYHAVVEFK